MKKKLFSGKRAASLLLAAALVCGLFSGAGHAAEENVPLTIDGTKSDDADKSDYIFYNIPENAPETVILDGRDAMDFLIQRGQNNEWWPGTSRWAYMQIQNQSGYTYRVTDLHFDLDHSQKQEDSLFLKDYDYNPYILGRGWADRPEGFAVTDTGAVGFDGYQIPSALAPLRCPNRVLQSLTGVSATSLTLEGAIKQQNYAQKILEYYQGKDEYKEAVQGVTKFSELPQYLVTDAFCGPTSGFWLEDDKVGDAQGNARWHKGDIKMTVAEVVDVFVPAKGTGNKVNMIPILGEDGVQLKDELGYPRYTYATVDENGQEAAGKPVVFDNGGKTYAEAKKEWSSWGSDFDFFQAIRKSAGAYYRYDSNKGTTTYYYIDKDPAGLSKKDQPIDLNQKRFEYVDGAVNLGGNPYFSKSGDLSEVAAQNWWKSGSEDSHNAKYYMTETEADIVKKTYDSFYSDMLSFTFDYHGHPLVKGIENVSAISGGEGFACSEISEGSYGMHYTDYLKNQGNAKKTMDETIRNIVMEPNSAQKRTLQLKLSGQNVPNSLAGTEYLRGLTFQITLERVKADYTVEYYKDSLDSEPLGADSYTGDLGGTVSFPAGALNKYRPVAGGYHDGALQGAESIKLVEDASKNVFRVLYLHDPYTVLYDANGGTGSQTDEANPYFADDTVTVLGQGTVARDGYTFLGWNTEAQGTGTGYAMDDTFTMPEANVTLYAQWRHDPYTVLYDANGGTGSQTDEANPYFAGSNVVVLNQGGIIREGYTFTGWNTVADGSGTAYRADDAFAMPKSDVTLYAQWTLEEEEIPDNPPPLDPPNPPEEDIPDEDLPIAPPDTGREAPVAAALLLAVSALALFVGKKKQK